MLEARGRVSISRPVDDWVEAGLQAPWVHFVPMSPHIAIESTRLPDEPHGDPADRILMSTARAVGARLVTCDRSILDYAARGHLAVLDARPGERSQDPSRPS